MPTVIQEAGHSARLSSLINPRTSTIYPNPGTAYQRRAAPTPPPLVTGTVPPYASPDCADATQYWSACQCFGLTPTTVTINTPTTTIVAPTATCTRAVQYAIYTPTSGWTGNASIAALVGGKVPDGRGWSQKLGGFEAEGGQSISPYGGTVNAPCDYNIIDHRLYLHPLFPGVYTFSVSVADDLLALWLGPNAVSGFSIDNVAFKWEWASQPWPNFQYTVSPSAVGTFIPMRVLWANNGGRGALGVSLKDPNGLEILGANTDVSDQIVWRCVLMGANQAPIWIDWETESPA